jgi:hypothetical protein
MKTAKLHPKARQIIKAMIRKRWEEVERRLKRLPVQLEFHLVENGGPER